MKCKQCDHLKRTEDGEDWCRMKRAHVLNINRERECKVFIPEKAKKFMETLENE